ncbi:MAG TPA: DNA internalization-related competence protein ComEC/Rec2, partial [Vicinamibacterales bacterium]|nr:DNA internalization-related competence protein ComEC/Rec2 [Vicinamibacterales bacterium]
MRHIAAIPAVGLLAGAAFGLVFSSIPRAPAFLLLTIAVIVAAWACWKVRTLVLSAAVASAFFAGGALLASDAWQRAWRPSLRVVFEALAREERAAAAREGRRLPEDDEAFAIVRGTLRADAAPAEDGVSLSIEVDALEGEEQDSQRIASDPRSAKGSAERQVQGGILVNVAGALAAEHVDDWRAGRRIRGPVRLHRPSRYLDPGVPDHERALARRGTMLTGTVKSGALVEVLARGSWWDEALSELRARSRCAIAAGVGRWSAQSAAIVAAIVIGDRAGLDAGVQRQLQEAGTYHVIAISGGNIAILAGLLLGAFRFAGRLGSSAMVASMAMLLAYADFVGNGASVDRATVMAVVYLGARAVAHRTPPLNALAVTAALLVLIDPLAVADPAFVLTCGATLAILVVVPVVGEVGQVGRGNVMAHAHQRQRWTGWAVPHVVDAIRAAALAMFAASLATEALLFPVGAIVFSRVTFAGLGLNFLAIPLMALAQVAGMLVVVVGHVSMPAAVIVGFVAHAGAAGLVRSAGLVRLAPFLAYRVAPPSWIVVAIYYASVVAWWALWRRRVEVSGSRETVNVGRLRRFTAAAAAIAALWILVDPRTLVAPFGDGRLHMTVVDVGQGDAIFVVFPRGSTLLVDAGGLSFGSSFDIGDRVVAPVIRDAGFRRLDFVALTHGDPDHIGGAASILDEFRPREVWEGIPVPQSAALTGLRLLAQSHGARWANVYAGNRASIDGVEVVARHPAPADWERQKVRNDDSLVLELRWRDLSIVLTGDAGRAVERDIASSFPPARLRIVKIPHHGSLTSSSSEFLAALHPQLAIVSAGRNNHFGHPVPEVLDRYRAIGAELFRTDQDGAVMVDS